MISLPLFIDFLWLTILNFIKGYVDVEGYPPTKTGEYFFWNFDKFFFHFYGSVCWSSFSFHRFLQDFIRRCLTYNQAERPDVLTIAQDQYLTYTKKW